MMLSVRSDRPLQPTTVAVIREIDSLMQELKLRYFLCGAMARDILLQHVYGIATGTVTADVDFAIAIEDWHQFETIKTGLIERKFEPSKKMAHRFYYRPAARADYPVDIIPFGKVAKADHRIEWPPDQTEIMSVIGYAEALASTVEVLIEEQFAIPVTSLPGLVLLKLFAWTDRSLTVTKDALDIATVMRTYHEAGNEDRLYGQELRILQAAEFDLEAASPHLLGKDIRNIATPETLNQVLAILNDAKQLDRLFGHMAPRLRYTNDAIAEAESLLKRFKAGLNGE